MENNKYWDNKDLNIHLSWAINNATEIIKTKPLVDLERNIKEVAIIYLKVFDEMKRELDDKKNNFKSINLEKKEKSNDMGLDLE